MYPCYQFWFILALIAIVGVLLFFIYFDLSQDNDENEETPIWLWALLGFSVCLILFVFIEQYILFLNPIHTSDPVHYPPPFDITGYPPNEEILWKVEDIPFDRVIEVTEPCGDTTKKTERIMARMYTRAYPVLECA